MWSTSNESKNDCWQKKRALVSFTMMGITGRVWQYRLPWKEHRQNVYQGGTLKTLLSGQSAAGCACSYASSVASGHSSSSTSQTAAKWQGRRRFFTWVGHNWEYVKYWLDSANDECLPRRDEKLEGPGGMLPLGNFGNLSALGCNLEQSER